MNEIERKFHDAFIESDIGFDDDIVPGVVIGPYQVDFVCFQTVVVEIDGHEYHKTKEQRSKDYKRERFLQKEGYTVVRFMGTEVFLEPDACIDDLDKIHGQLELKEHLSFCKGMDSAGKKRRWVKKEATE